MIGLKELFALSPILITVATAVIVMLSVSVKRHHFLNATLTVIGLNAALIVTFLLRSQFVVGFPVTDLLIIDQDALFGFSCVLVATLGCATLLHAYLEGLHDNKEEMYLLLLVAAVGGMILVSARNLMSFFIGLELVSIPVYGMIGYLLKDQRSLEASVKYLVLSAAASTFLLFGMALIYAETGSLGFAELAAAAHAGPPLMLMGLTMMIIAVAFKLSLAPFHLWTPDVYQGAPAPVGAFLATVSKIAVFLVVLRFWTQLNLSQSALFTTVLAVLAGISIIAGNLLALRQANIKRLLAYSSIAHFGYLLIALIAGNDLTSETVMLYLTTYLAASLGAFGVLTLLSSPHRGNDAQSLADIRGLFWQRPYLAAILTVSILSMAGIPMTAGFIAKFLVVATGIQSGLWWLIGVLVLGSAIAIYYYLRVIVSMFLAVPGERRMDAAKDWGQQSGGIITLALALFLLAAGLYPQPLLDLFH